MAARSWLRNLDPMIENRTEGMMDKTDLGSPFEEVDLVSLLGKPSSSTMAPKRQGSETDWSRVSLTDCLLIGMRRVAGGAVFSSDKVDLPISGGHLQTKRSPASSIGEVKDKRPRHEQPSIRSNNLHVLCCKQNVMADEIREAISRDPTAASQKLNVPTLKKVYNAVTGCLEAKKTYENYRYPLNLAIRYNAGLDVIQVLLAAAPEVPDLCDGSRSESSLHILLKYSPTDVKAVDALLLHNPRLTSPLDRHGDTVIHTACRHSAPLPVVRHLIIMFPDALRTRNFHHETVADVAQRYHALCSTEVASYVCEETDKLLSEPSEAPC